MDQTKTYPLGFIAFIADEYLAPAAMSYLFQLIAVINCGYKLRF